MQRRLLANGDLTQVYMGGLPWQDLGTELRQVASAREALAAANLDWEVEKLPLYAGRMQIDIPGLQALVRNQGLIIDSASPVLGLVGEDYFPLQNQEALDLFERILAQSQATCHRAGVIGQGERIWLLARVPGSLQITEADQMEKHLLLTNCHGENPQLQLKLLLVRPASESTLTLPLLKASNRPARGNSPSRSNARANARALEEIPALMKKKLDEREQLFQRMAQVPMDEGRSAGFLRAVFPHPKIPSPESVVAEHRAWSEYFFYYGRGSHLAGVTGTLWAALNGVWEWVDHCQCHEHPDQRLNYLWFGQGHHIKRKACLVAEKKLLHWQT